MSVANHSGRVTTSSTSQTGNQGIALMHFVEQMCVLYEYTCTYERKTSNEETGEKEK